MIKNILYQTKLHFHNVLILILFISFITWYFYVLFNNYFVSTAIFLLLFLVSIPLIKIVTFYDNSMVSKNLILQSKSLIEYSDIEFIELSKKGDIRFTQLKLIITLKNQKRIFIYVKDNTDLTFFLKTIEENNLFKVVK